MLYFLQHFFHAGNVTIHGNAAMFQIIKLTDLVCIIEHFTNYPLKTQKHADYLLFKKAFDIISNKEHLTKTGLDKLVSLKSVILFFIKKKGIKVYPKDYSLLFQI
jgi:hypothetical protein